VSARGAGRRLYKLNDRAPLKLDPPFTPDNLRALLADALGEDYKTPGDTEIATLASILNFWHQYFYQAQKDRALNDLLDNAEDKIKKLRETLPEIITARRPLAEAGDWFSGRMNRHAEALLSLLTDVNAIGFLQRLDLPDAARDWRWLAKVLPTDIETALRTENPHYRGGFSKRGPLARVLAAVIPFITGETVTAPAVGTQLTLLHKAA
jgi:hypothetical protein